jgi:hypothetical protein
MSLPDIALSVLDVANQDHGGFYTQFEKQLFELHTRGGQFSLWETRFVGDSLVKQLSHPHFLENLGYVCEGQLSLITSGILIFHAIPDVVPPWRKL